MKFVASVLSAGLLVATLHANAVTKVIECRNPSGGEGGQTLKMTILNPGMPGVDGKAMVTVTEGWFGGTRTSGSVSVDIITAADGGPMTLVNRDKGFAVTYQSKADGHADIHGKFADASGAMSGQLAGTFQCTSSN